MNPYNFRLFAISNFKATTRSKHMQFGMAHIAVIIHEYFSIAKIKWGL